MYQFCSSSSSTVIASYVFVKQTYFQKSPDIIYVCPRVSSPEIPVYPRVLTPEISVSVRVFHLQTIQLILIKVNNKSH